ncbi:glutathione binding-like protein [Aestuariicoccus sp. MJ-SS9]|uniref:glutathione binding-like protein n=1 Tax=Aestuariicoccus sp. MJ-SS9 TaxID=3079855 RepID=UPI00290E29E7|nr:glutathione binding-like protein [Aestuariicoccus sp. MJ-SS9]MDU8910756.1 glutathione binding-like protein [Aestuariicoccus sp. MJ-SS9]
MAKPYLITLLPSADVDLGRWLLQHYQQGYIERPHAPVFHVLALKWYGFGKDDYPLLVDGDTKTPTVDKILPLLEAQAPDELKLIPSDPALAAEVEAHQKFARSTTGHAVVLWSYFNLLKYKRVVWPSLTTHVPWYEKMICFLAFGLIRDLMYKGLGLNKTVSDQALQTIYEGFDHFDKVLADGRDYLVGDRLTFADLALASGMGPLILAQGYHGMLPNHAMCPPYMQKVYAELRQRPTGLFIQKIYDRHRAPALLSL